MVGITFKVAATAVCDELLEEVPRATAFDRLSREGRVEQLYESDARLVQGDSKNQFLQAVRAAFFRHYPLTIAPDVIWFCIAQGLANHVNKHAEALRGAFVAHEGQKKLVVMREDFVLGQRNPWPEVFSAFSEQIATHVGKVHGHLVSDFSTTGPNERAASEIVVMDTFQRYFKYEMLCGCGIPSITLAGTPEDWRNIRRRAASFAEYGLQPWLDTLLPVLDKLVDTAEGRPDIKFWKSMYRYQGGSGPSQVTGWIGVLFPYLQNLPEAGPGELTWNPFISTWREAWLGELKNTGALTFEHKNVAPGEGNFPSGLCSAPVLVKDVLKDTAYEVRFIGGMFGVVQDPQTFALQPEFGWAIVQYPDSKAGWKPVADEYDYDDDAAFFRGNAFVDMSAKVDPGATGDSQSADRAQDLSNGGKRGQFKSRLLNWPPKGFTKGEDS